MENLSNKEKTLDFPKKKKRIVSTNINAISLSTSTEDLKNQLALSKELEEEYCL